MRAGKENNVMEQGQAEISRFAQVDERIRELLAGSQDVLLIAIEGRTGAGKTTISQHLQETFDCNIFHLDDFYLQGWQRTPERLSQVGGNVDYERFREEVLEPVLQGETVHLRPFDYLTMDFDESRFADIPAKRLNIIEGSYSMNPYFGDPYDLRIFMDVGGQDQIGNILRRQGDAEIEDYENKWIPKVDTYVEQYDVKNRCDLVITYTDPGQSADA